MISRIFIFYLKKYSTFLNKQISNKIKQFKFESELFLLENIIYKENKSSRGYSFGLCIRPTSK